MIEITNNDLSVLTDGKVQVLDFNAVWCGPCKALKPKLEELSKEYTDVEFAGVDADENEELCTKFGIRNIPVVIIRKTGMEDTRIIGAVAKEKIVDALSKYL